MTDQTPVTAPRHMTSRAISIGVTIAAGCFLVALVAEALGVEPNAGSMTDLGALVAGATAWSPWAWAALGSYAVVVTPIVGLVITAFEYASVSDRRTVLLVVVVLSILATSLTVSLLR